MFAVQTREKRTFATENSTPVRIVQGVGQCNSVKVETIEPDAGRFADRGPKDLQFPVIDNRQLKK